MSPVCEPCNKRLLKEHCFLVQVILCDETSNGKICTLKRSQSMKWCRAWVWMPAMSIGDQKREKRPRFADSRRIFRSSLSMTLDFGMSESVHRAGSWTDHSQCMTSCRKQGNSFKQAYAWLVGLYRKLVKITMWEHMQLCEHDELRPKACESVRFKEQKNSGG